MPIHMPIVIAVHQYLREVREVREESEELPKYIYRFSIGVRSVERGGGNGIHHEG